MSSRYAMGLSLMLAVGNVACAGTPAEQPAAQPQRPLQQLPQQPQRTAPLLEGLGWHHFPITTQSKEAQRYFDQGLILAFAFNHKEAERSFREAARLDPQCAMAWWGAALVVGPHVNAAMKAEDAPRAWEALTKAKALAPNASAK